MGRLRIKYSTLYEWQQRVINCQDADLGPGSDRPFSGTAANQDPTPRAAHTTIFFLPFLCVEKGRGLIALATLFELRRICRQGLYGFNHIITKNK